MGQIFFPLTGLIISFFVIIVPLLNNIYKLGISSEFNSLIMISLYIFTTGGLHLDGFTDTIDGLSSQTNGERLKEIMKDSRIGAFGAIYLFILLLSKFIIYKMILNNLFSCILAIVFSRTLLTMVIYKGKFPGYNGMADFLHESNIGKTSYIFIALFLIFSFLYKKLLLIPGIITLLFTIFFIKFFERRIGYISGDILGFWLKLTSSSIL